MRSITTLIVCEGYDDFLRKTLPRNRQEMENIIVVTSMDDKKTHEVCWDMKVAFFITSRLHEGGAAFAKGKAINEAISFMNLYGWILLLDADIYLPEGIGRYLKNDAVGLDDDKFYHAGRVGYTEQTIDKRPLGFFQLFNTESKWLKGICPLYPEASSKAGGDDDIFGMYIFPTEGRHLFEQWVVRHMDHGKFKENWAGRKTPRIDCEALHV